LKWFPVTHPKAADSFTTQSYSYEISGKKSETQKERERVEMWILFFVHQYLCFKMPKVHSTS